MLIRPGHGRKPGSIELLEHGVEPLLAELRCVEPPSLAATEILRVERGYFTTNAARMDYPAFPRPRLTDRVRSC